MTSIARPKIFILSLVAVLLALTTSLALAQELLTQIASIDNVTIRFPEGWIADDSDGSTLVIGDSRASITAAQGSVELPADGIVLSIAPPSQLPSLGLEIDASPEAVLSVLGEFSGMSDPASAIESITIGGLDAFRLLATEGPFANFPIIAIDFDGSTVTLLTQWGASVSEEEAQAILEPIIATITVGEAIPSELPPAPTPESGVVSYTTSFGVGTLSLELPNGWEVWFQDVSGTLYVASSAALIEKIQANDYTYETGDMALAILLGSDQQLETLTASEVVQALIDASGDSNAEIVEDTTFGFEAARASLVSDQLPIGSAELFAVKLESDTLIFAIQPGGEIGPVMDALMHSVVYEVAEATPAPTVAPANGKPTLVPTVLATPTEAAPTVSGDATIAYGDSVVGTISRRENQQLFTFTGTAGDVVTITMLADDVVELDTRLSLFTAEGFEAGDSDLINNDDSGDVAIGTSNARIESFILPEDGDYIIQATTFRGTGDYTLTLEETIFELNNPDVALVYGGSVTGILTDDNTPTLWHFDGTEGDVVTISMVALNTTTLDTRLELYTTDGFTASANAEPLVANDDSNDFTFGYTNARIVGFTLPVTGEYVIAADRFFGTGLYTLTLETVVISMPENADTIAYGDTVTGTLTESALEQVWLFEGTAGDLVTITMLAEDDADIDSKLYLYNPAGYSSNIELISNDDAFGGDIEFPNSQIVEFELPSTDTYVIKATSFSANDTGDYTLILESDSGTSAQSTDSGGKDGTGSSTNVSDEVRQWASSASGTSQYGSASYSFMQATGAPNTDACGDYSTAWASLTSTGKDTLIVEFAEAVIPTQINIYQTYTPGSIIRVEVGSTETDTSIEIEGSADAPGNTECPGVFTLDMSGIDTLVNQVSIVLDQTIGGGWNEIDAVELVGTR